MRLAETAAAAGGGGCEELNPPYHLAVGEEWDVGDGAKADRVVRVATDSARVRSPLPRAALAPRPAAPPPPPPPPPQSGASRPIISGCGAPFPSATPSVAGYRAVGRRRVPRRPRRAHRTPEPLHPPLPAVCRGARRPRRSRRTASA
ncbi:hypothetical protein PVAP13_8KG199402 [Panicum virgatum]|uniref:Uncharacterized protein n=1 Tax=Panicum virgatum TaxID=38727 RepID=A0A8T0PGT8_PANVG|nr:hypothetical protein PVAP13_8KG199402 [Panicum virgatum]